MRGGQIIVNRLGLAERETQWVGRQGPDGIAAVAIPSRLSGQCLILAQHLDQSHHMLGQLHLRQPVHASLVQTRKHLHDQIIWEVGQRALVGQIDRQHIAAIIEDGVHGVQRQLQFVDAAARAFGIEMRLITLSLLLVVLPIVRHRSQNIFGPGGRFGLKFRENFLFEVVIPEIGRRD